MRTTLNIDDALLREATRLSGINEKTAVVRAGLEALIARESARRLAALGGSERFSEFRGAGHSRAQPAVMLVDTSVWVDHFRRGDRHLTVLLNCAEVQCHPFIIGMRLAASPLPSIVFASKPARPA